MTLTMDVDDPLNLSTDIKVESSEIQDTKPSHSSEENFQDPIDESKYVFVQTDTENHDQVMTITGEVVNDQSDNMNISKQSENVKKDHQCPFCPKKFSRANALKLHERSHIDELNADEQKKDLNKEHNNEADKASDPLHKCYVCDEVLPDRTSYLVHVLKHKAPAKKFSCNVCSRKFLHQYHLAAHIRLHTGEKPFKCDVCSSSFKQASHLTTHQRIHTKDRPYKCSMCNASFSQTSSLKRHIRSHTGERPFKCDLCNQYFVEKRNLKRHILTHSGIRPHSCHLCSSSFTQRIDLTRHIYSHSGTKPFVCDVCKSSFSRKSNLKWHQATHVGFTPYICPVCNAGFREMRDLKNHKKIHETDKGYKCVQCEATFTHMLNFKRHNMIHKAQKIHECAVCHITFGDRSSLAKHLKKHTDIKSFKCSYEQCPATYNDVQSFQKHFNTHSTGFPQSENQPQRQEVVNPNPVQGTKDPVVNNESEIIAKMPSVGELYVCHNANGTLTFYLDQNGQAAKAGKPAGDCQNHSSHVEVCGKLQGQWQALCFCDEPNIPNSEVITTNPDSYTYSEPVSVPQPIYQYDEYNQQPETKASVSYAKPEPTSSAVSNPSYSTAEYNPIINQITYHIPQFDTVSSSNVKMESDLPPMDNTVLKTLSNDPVTTESHILYTNNEMHHSLADINIPTTEVPFFDKSTPEIPVMRCNKVNEESYLAKNAVVSSHQHPEHMVSQQVDNPTTNESLQPDSSMSVPYSLTVNNPATGKIQIYTEAFSKPTEPIQEDQTKRIQKPKMYNCSHCNETFSKYKAYESHSKIHKTQKQYNCEKCSQSFSSCNSLMIHRRTHTGERPYSCQTCTATFTQGSNLRVHLRTHTGERPFECDLCDSRFSQGSHLKAHRRIHLNDRPFVCEVCNHGFTQKSTLKRHQVKHSGLRANTCPHCKCLLNENETLVVHKATCPKADSHTSAKKRRTVAVKTPDLPSGASDEAQNETVLQKGNDEIQFPDAKIKAHDKGNAVRPVRTSSRIREAAKKKKFRNEDSDFITGDLDEIDQVEKIENQLHEAKLKKQEATESVKRWCFCETPHGLDEPHTNTQPPVEYNKMNTPAKSESLVLNEEQPVIQLAMSDLSHAVILQADSNQNADPLHRQPILIHSNGQFKDRPNEDRSIQVRLSDVRNDVMGTQMPQELITSENNRTLLSTPMMNSQIFSNQLLANDGTLFIEASEMINDGSVVLNAANGSIFFDVTDDAQMMPITMADAGGSNQTNTFVSYQPNCSISDDIQSNNGCEMPVIQSMENASAEPVSAEDIPQSQQFTIQSLDNSYIEFLNPDPTEKPETTTKTTPIIVVPKKCKLCSKEFAQKCRLAQHMETDHPDMFICTVCADPFYTADQLAVHKTVHENTHVCDICHSGFNTKSQLAKHKQAEHQIPISKKHSRQSLPCPKCSKTFSQKSDLNRHLASHDGLKSFSCSVCGVAFTRNYTLNKHMRKHTGEKPFACKLCDQKFAHKYQCTTHMKSVHQGR